MKTAEIWSEHRLTSTERKEGPTMKDTYTWSDALAQAHDELGYKAAGADIPRSVGGIRQALREDLLSTFYDEISELSDGISFEVFLDHWWTQVVVDAAPDEGARESALDFADLTVALRISHAGGPTVSAEEVAAMLESMDAEEQSR